MNRSTLWLLLGALAILGAVGLAIASAFKRPPAPPQVQHVAPIGAEAKTVVPEARVAEPRTPALAAFLDRSANLEKRLPNDFAEILPRVDRQEDLAEVRARLRDRTESDTLRHEAITLLRRSGDVALDQALVEIVRDEQESERFRRFAIQAIGTSIEMPLSNDPSEVSGLIATLEALSTHSSPEIQREAFDSLIKAGRRPPEALMQALGNPSHAHLHDLAIHALHESQERLSEPAVALLRGMAQPEHPNIDARIAAIYVLAQRRDDHSTPAFEAAHRSSEPRLQRAGAAALRQLGVQVPDLNPVKYRDVQRMATGP